MIDVALEHQSVLAKIMTGPGELGVYPHVTPNLIRPAFEAALTAFWLLDGKDSRTRVLRGLRQSWVDHRQSRSTGSSLKNGPTSDPGPQNTNDMSPTTGSSLLQSTPFPRRTCRGHNTRHPHPTRRGQPPRRAQLAVGQAAISDRLVGAGKG